jgi:hypothetical protein
LKDKGKKLTPKQIQQAKDLRKDTDDLLKQINNKKTDIDKQTQAIKDLDDKNKLTNDSITQAEADLKKLNDLKAQLDAPGTTVTKNGQQCTTIPMLVTAYSDTGPGSDAGFFKKTTPPGKPGERGSGTVGPGTVAVANTSPKPYPFGSTVTVKDISSGAEVYKGEVHDTGAGWDKKHRDVPAEQWIDVWKPAGKEASNFKVWASVEICRPKPVTP